MQSKGAFEGFQIAFEAFEMTRIFVRFSNRRMNSAPGKQRKNMNYTHRLPPATFNLQPTIPGSLVF